MSCFKYIFFLSLISVLGFGCKKFVEIPAPGDRILSADVFSSDAKASDAMAAVYGQTINGSTSLINSQSTLFGGLSADELVKFNPSANEQELMNNALNPANTSLKNLWVAPYQSIYYANAILEGMAASTGMTAAMKQQLEGECRFFRALNYFYLVNYFGGVPMVTGTDHASNSKMARASAAEVYQLIVTDLETAKSLLPAAYLGTEKIRPNKWTAVALLARVQLYRQEWSKAAALAGEVINSGSYQLLSDPASIFLKNSKEAIWHLSPNSGILREVQLIRPLGAPAAPQYTITASAVNWFETIDLRRKWMDSLNFAGTRYYFPAKYRNTTSTVTEYYTMFRLAELYLVRAEARVHGGDLPGAILDINTIRNRAGLSNTTGATPGDLLAAIADERKKELFAEMGHRWLDLKRTATATAILSPLKPGWSATDELYPVPLDELNNNPSLLQNPGY